MSLLAVSVDLDEIDCYAAIHGIECRRDVSSRAVYMRALPRIADFFLDLKIPVTLFAVGKDLLASPESVETILEMHNRGSEIANHTMNHRYDFFSLSQAEKVREIDEFSRLAEKLFGHKPLGFRAPGYNIDKQITDHLSYSDYLYDSSVFPCPLYYSAKALVIGLQLVQGRMSKAKMGDPRLLSAPKSPYRIGQEGPWSKGNGLAELPITVLTKAKLPFVGTSLTLAGLLPSVILARTACKLPFVNLELHGMDFADLEGDGLDYLAPFQRDLRTPYVKRKEIIKAAIETLIKHGFEPVTLSEATRRIFI